MNGRQFGQLLRRLDPDQLDLSIDVLVALYDVPTCHDCGRHHESPWAAIACDEQLDARRRMLAARRYRLDDD